jgi:hypothetical protein
MTDAERELLVALAEEMLARWKGPPRLKLQVVIDRLEEMIEEVQK